MKVFNIITLIFWVFIGIYNLVLSEEISKFDYAMAWIMSILLCITNLFYSFYNQGR